jgi:hypothetical protein
MVKVGTVDVEVCERHKTGTKIDRIAANPSVAARVRRRRRAGFIGIE